MRRSLQADMVWVVRSATSMPVMMSRSTATVAAEAVWSRWRPRPESPERHAGRWQLMTVHPFCVSLVMK